MDDLNYLSQVKKLRALAALAIEQFPIEAVSMEFINHGENTTYKIRDKSGEHFLLRVHRHDYHTTEAINDELRWLLFLSHSAKIKVPEPLALKGSVYIAEVGEGGERRRCTLLKWVYGRSVRTAINQSHLETVGELTAALHLSSLEFKSSHRNYWDADGLLGKSPFMGRTDCIPSLSASKQRLIDDAQQELFKRLRAYEIGNPQGMGFLHADLHFNNMFFDKGRVIPIDFDDCGHGFLMYDLAVTAYSLEKFVELKAITTPKKQLLIEAMLERYSQTISISDWDLKIFKDLLVVRRFVMLQWIYLHSARNTKLASQLDSCVDDLIDGIESIDKGF